MGHGWPRHFKYNTKSFEIKNGAKRKRAMAGFAIALVAPSEGRLVKCEKRLTSRLLGAGLPMMSLILWSVLHQNRPSWRDDFTQICPCKQRQFCLN